MKKEKYVYIGLEKEGVIPLIATSVFKGNNEEPSSKKIIPFNVLLDEYVEMNIIPNGTARPEHIEEILFTFKTLKRIIKAKKKFVKNIPQWEGSHNVV